MRFTSKNHSGHSVDLSFSLALFLLFTATGISLVLTGARIYRSTAAGMEETFTSETALSYVAEKIHQTDKSGAIELKNLSGFSDNTLVLHETIKNKTYDTYIYYYEGTLRELFIKSGTDISPEQGTVIVSLDSFSIEETEDHFYILSVTEKSGKSNCLMIHPKSI